MIKDIVQKTNGKKTTAVSILSVLFEALILIKPELIDSNTQAGLRVIINSGLLTTLLHKVWRNRRDIVNFFKKKKNDNGMLSNEQINTIQEFVNSDNSTLLEAIKSTDK